MARKRMKDNIPFESGARVAAYLRDSGHEEQELSVEQQEAALRAWCKTHDLRLAQVFIDAAAPGSTTVGRDAFREMIAHFHASDCREEGIILWKYNRFARDIDDAQFYRADLRRRGYIIHSLNDSVPAGLDGRFFEAAIDWMNARYLDDLSVDVKRGLHHIMQMHGALGGTPPRGFKRQAVEIGVHRDGRPRIVSRWAVDADLVERVRLAFEMRAAGASLRQIQRETQLYENINGWSGFFRNRLYIGEMVFGGRVYPDYCEPIVSREIWEAVQKRNRRKLSQTMDADMRKTHPRRSASRYMLSGLLVCGECGAPMNAALSTVHKQKRSYRYSYYGCSRAGRTKKCNAGRIPRLLIEKAVLDNLADYILEPRHVQLLMDELNHDQNTNQQILSQQRKKVLRQITAVRRKIDNLVDALADG
ncbi:MAG: recombinase family protein, partial [Chloroflexota bacterium]